MENPDPQQFARHVLSHLTWMRAEVIQIRALMLELMAGQNPDRAKDLTEKWEKEVEDLQEHFYGEALRDAGIPPEPEEPPPAGETNGGRFGD